MRKVGIKDAVELIGIAAIVASLVFVGLQIRQEQEIAIVSTHGELSQSKIDLTFKIGEHMEIWKRGLNKDQLTEEELAVFTVQAAAVAEFHQRTFIRWLRIGPVDPGVAASRYAFALYVFPGLRHERESYNELRSFIGAARGSNVVQDNWETAVSGYLEQYDREKPPMPAKKRYIFWAL